MSAPAENLKEHIKRKGNITFAEFMETALYHPQFGYYSVPRERIGAGGDFFTSPATHPVFAALISLKLEEVWLTLERPQPFTIVEMGAGKGLLAADIISYSESLSPEFYESLAYVTLEKGREEVVRWPAGIGVSTTGVTGCFLSNELVDSFPVHRVAMRGGRLQEVYVGLEDGHFIEVTGPLSSASLEQRFVDEGITLVEGQSAEVNLNIGPWMKEVADRLGRGLVLTIDYGHLAGDLYAPGRYRGTLMTYFKHMCGDDPFTRIGEQDITAHVDFTSIVRAGEQNGLRFEGLFSQRDFLMRLGLDVFLKSLAREKLSYPEYLANRFSMLELVREEGLGGFKVLMQSKNLPEGIDCANLRNRAREELENLPLPLLGQDDHMPLLGGKYPSYEEAGTWVFRADPSDVAEDRNM